MDTQLIHNFSLVEEIKKEAIDFNIYEAFLESAPQVLVQLWAKIYFLLDGNQKYLSQILLCESIFIYTFVI
jgi:hypothetical protein